MKKLLVSLALLVVLIGIASAMAWARGASTKAQQVPTARVQQGRIDITVHATGELRASRALQVFTPAMGVR